MPFEHQEQICPVCHIKFTPTRDGKTYCSEKCKNRYHNLVRQKERKKLQQREAELKSNRDQLARLMLLPEFRSGITRDNLIAGKMNMEVKGINRLHPETGVTILCWLDYGIELIDPATYKYRIIHIKQ
jgi:hypothetical protein